MKLIYYAFEIYIIIPITFYVILYYFIYHSIHLLYYSIFPITIFYIILYYSILNVEL